jgi:hypothetical protein
MAKIQPMPRNLGASVRASPVPISPSATDGRLGSISADRFTTSTDAPPLVETSKTPAASDGD